MGLNCYVITNRISFIITSAFAYNIFNLAVYRLTASNIMKLITERLKAIESFCSSLDLALIGSTMSRGGIYSISIMNEIRIQGNYSSLIVNRIRDAYPDSTNEITQGGYVEFKIDAFDCKFEVVLT